jgi:hypothetical protein
MCQAYSYSYTSSSARTHSHTLDSNILSHTHTVSGHTPHSPVPPTSATTWPWPRSHYERGPEQKRLNSRGGPGPDVPSLTQRSEWRLARYHVCMHAGSPSRQMHVLERTCHSSPVEALHCNTSPCYPPSRARLFSPSLWHAQLLLARLS